MKKLLVTLAAVLVASASTWAQGVTSTITIDNRNLTDAGGATYQGGITGDTTGATAQLFLVGTGGALTALTPTTTFRTGAAAAFLTAQNVDVPGVKAGTSATFRLDVWVGGTSYDTATIAHGRSADFTVANLGGDPGGGAPPILPPKLNGLQGFALSTISVPEPSTIALAALGAAALFIRRRK